MHGLSATVYAKDLGCLAAFYRSLLDLSDAEAGTGFVLMAGTGVELAVVQIPPEIADAIVIAAPPQPREDTPIKLSFRVASIDSLRTRIAALGGQVQAPDRIWDWRGHRHLDGWDPEGNVFQLREPLSDPTGRVPPATQTTTP